MSEVEGSEAVADDSIVPSPTSSPPTVPPPPPPRSHPPTYPPHPPPPRPPSSEASMERDSGRASGLEEAKSDSTIGKVEDKAEEGSEDESEEARDAKSNGSPKSPGRYPPSPSPTDPLAAAEVRFQEAKARLLSLFSRAEEEIGGGGTGNSSSSPLQAPQLSPAQLMATGPRAWSPSSSGAQQRFLGPGEPGLRAPLPDDASFAEREAHLQRPTLPAESGESLRDVYRREIAELDEEEEARVRKMSKRHRDHVHHPRRDHFDLRLGPALQHDHFAIRAAANREVSSKLRGKAVVKERKRLYGGPVWKRPSQRTHHEQSLQLPPHPGRRGPADRVMDFRDPPKTLSGDGRQHGRRAHRSVDGKFRPHHSELALPLTADAARGSGRRSFRTHSDEDEEEEEEEEEGGGGGDDVHSNDGDIEELNLPAIRTEPSEWDEDRLDQWLDTTAHSSSDDEGGEAVGGYGQKERRRRRRRRSEEEVQGAKVEHEDDIEASLFHTSKGSVEKKQYKPQRRRGSEKGVGKKGAGKKGVKRGREKRRGRGRGRGLLQRGRIKRPHTRAVVVARSRSRSRSRSKRGGHRKPRMSPAIHPARTRARTTSSSGPDGGGGLSTAAKMSLRDVSSPTSHASRAHLLKPRTKSPSLSSEYRSAGFEDVSPSASSAARPSRERRIAPSLMTAGVSAHRASHAVILPQ